MVDSKVEQTLPWTSDQSWSRMKSTYRFIIFVKLIWPEYTKVKKTKFYNEQKFIAHLKWCLVEKLEIYSDNIVKTVELIPHLELFL